MGLVLGALAQLGYGVAYRVLDAQFHGVPQQRHRIVFVGHLGDWAAPVEVLLEPESGGGDPAPRGPAQAGPSVVTALRAGSGGGPDDNDAQGGRLIVGPLQAQGAGGRGHRIDAEGAASGHLVQVAAALTARQGKGVDSDAIQTLLVDRGGGVTHALTSDGSDGSEDGTGRGTPLVAFDWKTSGSDRTRPNVSDKRTSALGTTKQDAVATAAAVRRLTPMECERLQGFPDGWTLTSWGKPQSDAARYRQTGNAIAVPVFERVARRMARHDQAAGL